MFVGNLLGNLRTLDVIWYEEIGPIYCFIFTWNMY